MVLDVDDAVWLNTGGHRARGLAMASDLIVCGNTFLANHFSRWNSNVTVIPTAVNTAWYRPHRPREADGTGVMGWTGTSGNFPFLYAIEGALLRVFEHCGQAKLLVVADRPPQFKSLPASRIEFERWTPRTEQAAFDRMSIGLMPLADTDWCNGKCSYKMLCYMAAGLPVVVTAAGMNREVLALGEVGLSAASEREWVDALIALLDNPNLRREMGAAGRAVVEQRFSLQTVSPAVCGRIPLPGRNIASRSLSPQPHLGSNDRPHHHHRHALLQQRGYPGAVHSLAPEPELQRLRAVAL